MFGEILGKFKSKAKKEPQTLSGAITQSIHNVVGTNSIPSMPGAAQKAFQLATDPNAEARDFIEVIESDEAMSARVIKVANS
ncbi:MAG: HDOD domain-containing protein, partial [Deltaproteobacteria bacterium]|nr:HDOD domain-containing protein [Deltaproteobacteria bacterium]